MELAETAYNLLECDLHVIVFSLSGGMDQNMWFAKAGDTFLASKPNWYSGLSFKW
jgi:hypothetical protein